MNAVQALPPGLLFFERGWLSSNNILFVDHERTVLVDTGYHTHAAQTLALVDDALKGRPLDEIVNTHLHSDHCGGNAALQARYPNALTIIPLGLASMVRDWDMVALLYSPTGQHCPRFHFNNTLTAGSTLRLGDADWEVHSAPGHDPCALMLFEPSRRTLISADALWEDGFGVVFPELEGISAFSEVESTLNLIERLDPRLVMPGHGPAFSFEARILEKARSRLNAFIGSPGKHARHSAKVLLKFKLLEVQRQSLSDYVHWACQTPYFELINRQHFNVELKTLVDELCNELVVTGAAKLTHGDIVNL